mmetsp:Transcript_134497/g.374853  ORF Transcript_134497/g.374853 Transcript_134497/m.374853 type:complete len:202 (-) Transcript_134497:1214-1819(-)
MKWRSFNMDLEAGPLLPHLRRHAPQDLLLLGPLLPRLRPHGETLVLLPALPPLLLPPSGDPSRGNRLHMGLRVLERDLDGRCNLRLLLCSFFLRFLRDVLGSWLRQLRQLRGAGLQDLTDANVVELLQDLSGKCLDLEEVLMCGIQGIVHSIESVLREVQHLFLDPIEAIVDPLHSLRCLEHVPTHRHTLHPHEAHAELVH